MSGAETRVMRGQRALRLLCDQTRPAGAHLYLFGDKGLFLAASVGETRAPEGLLGFLKCRFAEGQDEMLTMTMAFAPDSVPPTAVSVFTDGEGMVHDPVFLTCPLDGAVRHAGVAVLAYREPPRRSTNTLLAAAVAAHLIRSGDTTGLAAMA